MNLSIGKFAEAGEVGVETVRFYQRKGLLDIPRQRDGIRRYAEADLRRLRFIRAAKSAGFSLEEITELQHAHSSLKRLTVQCSMSESGPCPILGAFEP